MADKDEQQRKAEGQKFIEALERLFAGEDLESLDIQDDADKQLLRLAHELLEQRPEPSDEFEQRLLEKLQASGKENTAAHPHSRRRERIHRWLPEWLTLPRVAAVAAALVLGLGTAGLTAAIISGGGPGRVADSDLAGSSTASSYDSNADVLDSMRSQDQPAASPAGEEVQAAPETASGAADSAGGVQQGYSSGAADIPGTRQVIQTADYEIEIASGEFQQKYDQVTDLAARYGGYIVSASTSTTDEEDAIQRGTITIRVADTGDNFTKAMAELDGLGRVVKRNVSGQDVTAEYVDLQSRLRNAQAHEASLLELMAKAQTIDEMLMVESQLNSVRSEIEQLQGQINYLDSRTDFASISIVMYEEDAAHRDDNDSSEDWGFVRALRYAGWLAVQTVNFVIMALGIIVPAAIILILVLLVTYRLVERRRSKS